MFVYYFVQLARPFRAVEYDVLGLLESLDEMGAAAYRDGEAIRARIEVGGSVMAKTVEVRAGFPRRGRHETIVPITWKATGTPGLFPTLEADLVIAGLTSDLTQIALRGSYTPPLGALGRALDRTLLHRIAEASVKSFVDRLAFTIEEDAKRKDDPPVHVMASQNGEGAIDGNHLAG